ncbi:MAG TPA: alpha/beta family hydrolase [Bryobacteraceae bacterium]|nr:alpha/beta family hydrolase [Bryobacteraceae bacterium]
MPRKIESLFLEGSAGRLEALLEEPEDGEPREAALVCHPHPQHGGTMHNKVVYRIARGLRSSGAVVLRFNYRGVNLSAGEYAHGEGELEDARTALAYLRGRYPALPFTLAGFSFGSRIVLRLGCEGVGARRVIAVGFPTVYNDRAYLEDCTLPRIFIQSTHDQYGPVSDLEPLVAGLPEPKKLILVEAGDHFFAGALDALELQVAGLG